MRQSPANKYLPSMNIDLDGNPDVQEISRIEDQPIDFTLVKRPWRQKQDRPELTETAKMKVDIDLDNHIQKQKTEDVKRRPQKEMDTASRMETIQEILKK